MSIGEMLIIDTQQVSRRIADLSRLYPDLAQKALYEAGKRLLRDAIEISPKVPIGHHRAKAGKRTGVGGALKRSGKVVKMPDGSVVVGFGMPYATYVHAGQRQDGTHVIRNWTEPGAGKEFLKKKLETYGSVYLFFVSEYIKRRSGG